METVDLGIDVGLQGLVVCGFAICFFVWAFSRVIRFLFELMQSRKGHVCVE